MKGSCVENEEWKLARLGKITASRISDMLALGKGTSRANYIAELAASRLSGKPHRNDFTSTAILHGVEFEPMARIKYELRNGVMVEGDGKQFTNHPSIKMAGCSCDGLVGDEGLFEAKCPNTKTYLEYYLSGEIPRQYRLQMTWQLACTRRLWCDFVAFDPDMPEEYGFLQIRFTPTQEEIEKMEFEVIKFDLEVEALIQKIKEMRL